MATVLVTGYGGFLGAAISRQLLDAGHHVRGVARGSYPKMQELGVETQVGDIRNAATLTRVMKGCDCVIHTAAKAGVWGRWEDYYSINTQATVDLLNAARQNSVRAFVYTSSPSVTFDGVHQSGVCETVPYPKKWLCFYPQTKALAEQAVLQAGQDGNLATCALRPHLIWGQGDPHLFPRVIERTLQGRLRRVGDGKNLIDVVHVESAAKAHVSAAEQLLAGDEQVNSQAFFLTDGKPVECWKWITRILEAANVAVPSRSISFTTAYRLGAILEASYWTLRRKQEPPMTRFVAAQLALDHYFSIDKARSLLDYNPDVDVDREFKRCEPWLQNLAANDRV